MSDIDDTITYPRGHEGAHYVNTQGGLDFYNCEECSEGEEEFSVPSELSDEEE
jgi:hypothetical protein